MNGPPNPYRLPKTHTNPYEKPSGLVHPGALMSRMRVFGKSSSGKTPDKPPENPVQKAPKEAAGITLPKPPEKIEEKAPEVTSAKTAEWSLDKTPEKSSMKASIRSSSFERITERHAVKTSEKPLDKTSETASNKTFGKISAKSSEQDSSRESQDSLQDRIRPLELAGIVVPNPFLRPLEHRLAPRDEYIPRHSRSSYSSGSIDSPITLARKRGQIILSLSGSTSHISSQQGSQFSTLPKVVLENVPKDVLTPSTPLLPHERQPLHIFSVATFLGDDDDDEIAGWLSYLGPYHKGEYNLSKPPRANLLEDFDYLPALYPANEIKRMAMYRQYEKLWEKYGASQAAPLAKKAADRFLVEYASVSFFDEDNEVRKVEWGHCEGEFTRGISLAAHVLYSTEVLVVLDTFDDWRFKGNPMVLGWPQIRFFAVAPMVADEQVIGAFAIYDTSPHESFGHADRQKLIEFSAIAMAGMVKQHEWISRSEDIRLTPLLQRDSSEFGTFIPNSAGSSVRPNALTKKYSHLSIDPRRRGDEHTPPSSSEENRLFGNPNTQMSRLHAKRAFTTPPIISTPCFYSISNISPLYDSQTPTPLVRNSRDAGHVPLGEVTIMQFMDLDDVDVCEQSEEEVAEDEDKPLYEEPSQIPQYSPQQSNFPHPGPPPLYPPPPIPTLRTRPSLAFVPQHTRTNINFKSIYSRPSLNFNEYTPSRIVRPQISTSTIRAPLETIHSRPSRTFNEDTPTRIVRPQISTATVKNSPLRSHPSININEETPTPTKLVRPQMSTSTILSLQSIPPTPHSPNYQVAATAACAEIASTLSFDLVYVVELKSNTDITNQDLLQEQNLRTKVLAYHPDTAPLHMNQKEHLTALRKGARLCETDHQTPLPGHYAWGILLPLTPGTCPFRTNGVVLGAFRFALTQASPPMGEVHSAIKSLRKAAEPLCEILANGEFRKPRRAERERERAMRKYELTVAEERREEYKPDLEGRRKLVGRYPAREGKLVVAPEQ